VALIGAAAALRAAFCDVITLFRAFVVSGFRDFWTLATIDATRLLVIRVEGEGASLEQQKRRVGCGEHRHY
jgi:hypothetical protein